MNNVKICKKDVCLEAKGKHADWIAAGALFLLLSLGAAALVKAAS